MTNCYCCSDTARQAIHLLQGWEAVCRTHALEAETEEPGIAVCEIEELEGMDMTTTQKIAEARIMVWNMNAIQTPEQMESWKQTILGLLEEAELQIVFGEEREQDTSGREWQWKADKDIEKGDIPA